MVFIDFGLNRCLLTDMFVRVTLDIIHCTGEPSVTSWGTFLKFHIQEYICSFSIGCIEQTLFVAFSASPLCHIVLSLGACDHMSTMYEVELVELEHHLL